MTRHAAVLGDPVDHSLSPLIHGAWIAHYGVDAAYTALAVPPDALGRTIDDLTAKGYAGFNLTLPHKVAVMEFCDDIDEAARRIGAVNTVVIDANGHRHGRNTDAFGFLQNLRDMRPEWTPAAGPALVLGAGGAARAVVHALAGAGVSDIVLCNRNPARAAALAAEWPGRVRRIDWAQRSAAFADAAVLVNTTSLGMAGQDALDIDLSRGRGIVYDIVYRPLVTPLLAQAGALGLPVVAGLGMLLQQARPAFQAWFGIMPDITAELAGKVEKAAL